MLMKTVILIPGVIIFLSLVFLTLFTGIFDLRSYFFSSYNPNCSSDSCLCEKMPLKVFMYDLPSRFNFEMIDHSLKNSTLRNYVPPWPRNSGLKRQHSVEYWMTISLLYDGDGLVEATRVWDPESADVFFVPFFSSQSFNTHGHNMTDPETEVDRMLQVEVMDLLRASRHWQNSQGRDHVIPMHHPNAFRFLRNQVNASILIVADFGRFPKSLSFLSKDVVAPYVHVVDTYVDDDPLDPFESRPTLLFFRGRTMRKDEGIVRLKLANILKGYEDVYYEQSFASEEGIKASSLGMRSSKFCLHPAGDTPSSCRLFDAIVSHCVPVIVSDRIELPFEDIINYREFSIFFSMEEALKPGYMIEHLRKIPRDKWIAMWRRLKNISHHYEFQYPPKKDDAVNMLWRQIRNKIPAVKLSVNRDHRLMIPDWWG